MSQTLSKVDKLIEYIEVLEGKYKSNLELNSNLKSQLEDIELENLTLTDRLDELKSIAVNRDDKLGKVIGVLSSLVGEDKTTSSNDVESNSSSGNEIEDKLKSHFAK